MKLNSILLGLVAGREVRSADTISTIYSLNGMETVGQLDDILANVTSGTVDDIEAQINLFNLGRRTPQPTEVEMRKFRNLKILVLWLQKEQKFGRYCYYGCHCLPEGSHNIAQGGYGKPKDNIDASCRRFGQCYKCLTDEHKEDKGWPAGQPGCIGEEIGYGADLLIDNDTGKHYIQCNNKLGSCRRNICECDKQLSENLALYEDEWAEQFHANRGGFERLDECHKPTGSGYKFEECCGSKNDFPYNMPRNTNQCCEGPTANNSPPDNDGKCY